MAAIIARKASDGLERIFVPIGDGEVGDAKTERDIEYRIERDCRCPCRCDCVVVREVETGSFCVEVEEEEM